MSSRSISRAFAFLILVPLIPKLSDLAFGQTTTLTTLHSFPIAGEGEAADYGPYAGLVQGSDGNFYGTTVYGGAYDEGSIFKITSSGNLTTLYSFCSGGGDCLDGALPMAGLIQGSDGNFYGTTELGGYGYYNNEELPEYDCAGCGTVFKVTPSGELTTLHSFCVYGSPYNECPDGSLPMAGVVEGNDGNFYGTALLGGAPAANGVIYKIASSGTYTLLYSFGLDGAGGGFPHAGLLQGSDGSFYGSSSGSGAGTIFKIASDGTFTNLYTSTITNFAPSAAMAESSDGNFYGTSSGGGGSAGLCGEEQDECSTVFKITPSGTLTIIYTFCSQPNCTDGNQTSAGLVFGSDGNFYGATYLYGEYSAGTLYRISPTGSLTTLYAFTGGSDSGGPAGTLVQGADGNFYGTTAGYVVDQERKDGGSAYKLSLSTPLLTPVQVSLSSSQVMPGKPITASLKVLNAFSLTMQQCYAFQNGTPLGKVPGTYNSSTQLYTFSTAFDAPATAGIYNYAVTCGGVESGFATLTVGDSTSTTLTASPNPVTPPANDTLTATVTRTTASGTPTGSVTFSVGTTTLGKASLNGSGVAILSSSSKGVAAGTYPVVATYSGDSSDVGSTSTEINVVVQKAK